MDLHPESRVAAERDLFEFLAALKGVFAAETHEQLSVAEDRTHRALFPLLAAGDASALTVVADALQRLLSEHAGVYRNSPRWCAICDALNALAAVTRAAATHHGLVEADAPVQIIRVGSQTGEPTS